MTGKSACHGAAAGELESWTVLSGVREYPMRVKCATLSWHTLMAALNKAQTVSTESDDRFVMQEPTTMAEEAQKTDERRPDGAPRALGADELEALRSASWRPSIRSTIRKFPVDIYELGLIYDINIDPAGNVGIKMTLTAPGCPVAGSMPGMVKDAVADR